LVLLELKLDHTCDVIGVATEFMVGVAGVEALPYVLPMVFLSGVHYL
jgi:hypothetical protein